MDTEAFLRAVVTTAEGFFNLATRPPDGQWKDVWFRWPEDIDAIVARGLSEAPSNNVYFSAHLFSEKHSMKQYVLPSRTIQADLDNAVVGNIRPNVLVETSPGRHQGYWLLPEQKAPELLELDSRQVTYNIVDADRSGWSLGHKMRLPGTLNHKYSGLPKPVKVLNATLVLTRLKLVPTPELQQLIASGEDDEWTPAEIDIGERELWAQTKPNLPREVVAGYDIRQADRSTYMWSLYCSAFRAGLDRDQVFWLAKGSKNNKFADNRYHGDYDLAKDIRRAERTVQVSNDGGDGKEIINATRILPGSSLDKKQLIAYKVRDLLEQQGSFVQTDDGLAWYVREDTGQPISVTRSSESLGTLMDIRFGLNPTEHETKFSVAYLQSYTKELGRRAISGVLSHYDPVQEAVMIHGGRRDVYRVDTRGVHSLVNGELDFIFPWMVSDEPFEPDLNNPIDVASMFEGCFDNLIEASSDQALALVRTWLVFLLLRSDAVARPILALLGQPGSGKSTLFRRIYVLLYGSRRSVNTITKSDDFDHAVSTSPFVVFDNVDSYSAWLPDKLATAAAPSSLSRRKLYTDNDTVVIRRDALLGITAHNPQFRREDIVDRLIMLNFKRLPVFKPESELIGAVIENRNRLWGGLIQDVKKVLDSPRPTEAEIPKFRVNDFARLGLRISRALGYEDDFRKALTLNVQEQVGFNLEEEDILVDTIQRWLLGAGLYGRQRVEWASSSEIWPQLQLAARDELIFTRHYRDAPRLARKLWSLQETLGTVFDIGVKYEDATGRRLWRIAEKS